MIDNEYANKGSGSFDDPLSTNTLTESQMKSTLEDESMDQETNDYHDEDSYRGPTYEPIAYQPDISEENVPQAASIFSDDRFPENDFTRSSLSETADQGVSPYQDPLPIGNPEGDLLFEQPSSLDDDPFNNNIAYVQSQQNMPSAIGSDYYNITDHEGWPIASLLVLLDGAKQPVRSEVHVHAELAQDAYEDTIYQAYKLLQNNYGSNEPLPLRILQAYQHGESYDVPLSAARPQVHRATTPREQFDWGGWDWKPLALGLAGLFAVILLIWGLSRLFGGGETGTTTEVEAQQTVEAQIAEPSTTTANSTIVATSVASDSGAAEVPESRNAHPAIRVGGQVQIKAEYILSLRSQPSASEGQTLGYMENLQRATVIDGPVRTAGNEDTIVWWFVELENGTKAWAAANTSTLTLLEPVQ